jgi:hypothetical protein
MYQWTPQAMQPGMRSIDAPVHHRQVSMPFLGRAAVGCIAACCTHTYMSIQCGADCSEWRCGFVCSECKTTLDIIMPTTSNGEDHRLQAMHAAVSHCLGSPS